MQSDKNNEVRFFADQFIGPDRAVGSVRVCVYVSGQ